MKYKIGEISSLLGIPSETLRFYEQKGLIHPTKDENSGYRYFSEDDYFRLLVIKSFRGFGFSLGEIVDMMAEPDVSERARSMERNAETLDRLIDEYIRIRDHSLRYALSLVRVPECLGRCCIEDSPAVYSYNIFENYYDTRATEQIEQITTQWMEASPFYHICFEFARSAMDNYESSREFRWGLSCFKHDAERLGLSADPPVIYRPSHKSVYTIFSSDEERDIPLSTIAYAFEFIRENGYTITGSAFGQLMYQPFSADNFIRYYAVWIPIE